MIWSDLFSILRLEFLILVIGILCFPLTNVLFSKFVDKGYIFSKILGIAFVSYLVFLLSVFRIVPFSSYSVLFSLIVLGVINLVIFKKTKTTIRRILPLIFFEELIFFASLVFLSLVRATNPDIHDLEKFMDFGFINSILRTDFFPPKDMWFTPFSINYYYFGHLITAVLIKISGINSAIFYNLMLGLIFALAFSASFSLAINFLFYSFKENAGRLRLFLGGLLGAFLVTLSGNLQVIYSFFNIAGFDKLPPFWKATFTPLAFPNDYWYPNATRFIEYTIHEFPSYSWVVSDLHGHVLDIPFVLFIVAILFSIILKRINLYYSVLIGFILSVLFMTNAWDGAIYLILTIFTLLSISLIWERNKIKRDLVKLLTSITGVVVSFFILSFPFNHFFKPFVSGIGVICSPNFLIEIGRIGPFIFEANHCNVSPLWQLFVLYGFFYFFVISFLFFLLKVKKLQATDFFILILVFTSTVLILIPEFLYVKDIYPQHYRANTMFKLTYQAFILLSLSTSYIAIRISYDLKKWKNKIAYIWFLPAIILLLLVLIYPNLAFSSYYNQLKNYKGLDGQSYLKTNYRDDFLAIDWINNNIKGQPVILEAQGDSYTDHGRISANTGLPTVLGWTVHEWLWRGAYDIPAPRIDEVKRLYESEKIEGVNDLIQKYNIKYVFIGRLERDDYNVSEEKFSDLGKVVFISGSTKIYKLNSVN